MTNPQQDRLDDLSRQSETETSLRPPGEVTGRIDPDAAGEADTGVDFDAGSAQDAGDGEVGRAGYDVDAVSGDTDAVRPQ